MVLSCPTEINWSPAGVTQIPRTKPLCARIQAGEEDCERVKGMENEMEKNRAEDEGQALRKDKAQRQDTAGCNLDQLTYR